MKRNNITSSSNSSENRILAIFAASAAISILVVGIGVLPLVSFNRKPEKKPLPAKKKDDKYHFKIVDEKNISDSDCGVSKVIFGEFVAYSGICYNDNVKVHFSIPLGADGKPVPNANNVVFHCPYLNEREFFKQRHHHWWSEKAGYTFFSMDINTKFKDISNPGVCYYYPESSFHYFVFKCQKIIEDKYKLEHRNLLLSGASGGGVMAENFVLKFWNKIDAAAYLGAHKNIYLRDPKARDARTACLIIHTTGDASPYGDSDYPLYIQALRMTCAPRWQMKGEKYFHHAGSPHSWKYVHLFIKSIVELRAKNNGIVPKYQNWPYIIKREHKKPLAFPSKEFYDAWQLIPHKFFHDTAKYYQYSWISDEKMKSGGIKRFLIKRSIFCVPKDGPPTSVVVFIHDPAEDRIGREVLLSDCMYYFLLHGYVGASIIITKNHEESMRRLVKLLEEIKAKKEWKDLPIYVCGLGIGGKMAAVAALKSGNAIEQKEVEIKSGEGNTAEKDTIRTPRIKKIFVINGDYTKSGDINALTKARGESKIPVVLLYSSKFSNLKPATIPKFTNVEYVDADNYTLDKEWFPTLQKIADGKMGSKIRDDEIRDRLIIPSTASPHPISGLLKKSETCR